MSIQPLASSGWASLVQTFRSATTNETSGTDDTDAATLIAESEQTSTDAVDALFGSTDDGSGDSLASILGSSSDTQSVFDSFAAEAKQVLLQAQEEAQKQSPTTDGTTNAAGSTDPSATTNGNTTAANDPLIQALAALVSPAAANAQSANLLSWL